MPENLREKRVALVAEARTFWDETTATCTKEKREPTDEERGRFDAMLTDAGKIKDEIGVEESRAADTARSNRLSEFETDLTKPEPRKTSADNSPVAKGVAGAPEYRDFKLGKDSRGNHRVLRIPCGQVAEDYRAAFGGVLGATDAGGLAVTMQRAAEHRALQKDSDTIGGYLSAPQEFFAQLIQAVDDAVFMRTISNVLPTLTTAESLGAPSLDNDPADPIWTTEIGTGDEDSTMSFGKRELNPHPLAKLIKISKTLLRRSTIGAEQIVRDRLAYKFSTVMENTFLNGSGSNQPLGVFTASANGISTGRDVSTGNTTTAMTFDGLQEARFNLKTQHRKNSSWIFHRDGVKQLATIKDGDGRYIWQQSTLTDEPDTLFARPIHESEFSPNTFTTGLYVGIIGDFSFYWIVDALTLTVQVLTELYAAANQNGYIGRLESDGMPVLEEAFTRVKLA